MTTEQGNKLIMFFDGAENTKIRIMGKMAPAVKYKNSYYHPNIKCNWPQFHKDWNALMPVVEKITRLNFEFQMNFGKRLTIVSIYDYENEFQVCQVRDDPKCVSIIESVRETAIQFIQWYNTTSTNQEGK